MFQMRIRNDKAMLTIVEARPEFRGEYSCRAANSEGEVFTRAHLDVIGKSQKNKFCSIFLTSVYYLLTDYAFYQTAVLVYFNPFCKVLQLQHLSYI